MQAQVTASMEPRSFERGNTRRTGTPPLIATARAAVKSYEARRDRRATLHDAMAHELLALRRQVEQLGLEREREHALLERLIFISADLDELGEVG
jgi:hypothetical protein